MTFCSVTHVSGGDALTFDTGSSSLSERDFFKIKASGLQTSLLELFLKQPKRESADWNFTMSWLNSDLGNIDEAEKYLKATQDIEGATSRVLAQMGNVQLNRGYLGIASIYLWNAIGLDDNNLSAHKGLSLFYSKVGRPEKSIIHSKKSYQLIISDRLADQEKAIARGAKSILKSSLPKSASTYLFQALRDTFGLIKQRVGVQSAHNHMHFYIVDELLGNFSRGGCISHDHIPASPHNLERIYGSWEGKIWVHLRDPRDAAVSAYHAFLGEGLGRGRIKLDRHRKLTDQIRNALHSDSASNQDIARYVKTTLLREYVEFCLSWILLSVEKPERVFLTTFEELVGNREIFFDRVCEFLEAGPEQCKRLRTHQGSAANRYRLGKIGTWRELFSDHVDTADNLDKLNAVLNYVHRSYPRMG